MQPRLMVIIRPGPDGEQFAVIRGEELVAEAAVWVADHPVVAFERMAASLRWCAEADMRTSLMADGVSADEAEAAISTARRRGSVLSSAPTTFERITRIGYRNRDGQEVVRRTALAGRHGQRVFVLRCTVCACEYGAYGIDADIRRCPACQDGPRGIPVPPE